MTETREIKFKAWNKEHNRMLGPYGIVDISYMSDGGTMNIKDWDDLVSAEDLDWIQFTGLKDKNGKEIYEGDILDDGIVAFDKGVFFLYGLGIFEAGIDDLYCLSHHNMTMCEVIGNIYENPELLEKQNV